MRNFAVRPDRGPGRRHALRTLVVVLVVLATSVLGAGFALAAQGDVQCNGVLNGGTPNDPIGKTVSSPHDDPATTAIEAYAGDTITYTVTWPPNGANKATVLDCLVTDPVIATDGSLDSYNTDLTAVAALALVTITDTSGSLGALGTDLGFEKEVQPNSGTYVYSMVMPAALVGHTFANRAKVEGTNESKSNFLVVSVVTPPAPNQAPVVSCPSMTANGLAVSYTASATDSDGTIANYHWDFGDGSTADTAGNTTSHTYAADGTYDVTVTVTDDDGATGSSSGACSITVAAPVIPNVPPVVSCPAMSINGLAVSYTATATDTDGTIANYHWVFGDGSTADTATNTTSHTYAADGTYNVTVTVTDDDGATGSSSGACAATVAAPIIVIPNLSPSVSCPSMSVNDLAVSYTATATDTDGTIANYHWVFGDGSTADTTGNTTSHTYATAGTYDVTVTVTDDDGATGSSGGVCRTTVAAAQTPAAPAPTDDDDPVDTIVLPARRTLPRTGADVTLVAWIAAAMLFGGVLLRGVKPRPVRLVYAGSGLVAQRVAQYGLALASNAQPMRRHAFRRM